MKAETELILQCNANSFIEQVIYSKPELEVSGLVNQPLLFCLAPESLEAGKQFFDTIRHIGKAEDHQITLLLNAEKLAFTMSGANLNGHIIIMAQRAPENANPEVNQATEEMIAREVEATFEVPEPVVETPEDLEQREVTVWELLDEMSRLNNELINTKRELIRKNKELERLQELLKKR